MNTVKRWGSSRRTSLAKNYPKLIIVTVKTWCQYDVALHNQTEETEEMVLMSTSSGWSSIVTGKHAFLTVASRLERSLRDLYATVEKYSRRYSSTSWILLFKQLYLTTMDHSLHGPQQDNDNDVELVSVKRAISAVTEHGRIQSDLFDPGEGMGGSEAIACSEEPLYFQYHQTPVTVDLCMIQDPKRTSRDLDPEHVCKIKESITADGYQNTTGKISVCVKSTQGFKDSREATDISSGSTLQVPVILIDGRHRCTVLRSLRNADTAWVHKTKELSVTLWRKKDGSALSELDVLGLSAALNEQSSNVRKPDFVDHLHASVSVVKVLKSMGDGVPENSLQTVVKEMTKARTLGKVGIPQTYRFAQIGLRLSDNDEEFKKIMILAKKNPRFGLLHISSDVLLSMDEVGFLLGVETMCGRFRHPLQTPLIKLRRPFYTCVMKLYDVLRHVSNSKKVTISSLLSMKLSGGEKDVTIRETIVSQMSRFTLVRTQDQADNRRVSTLQRRLTKILGALPTRELEQSGDFSKKNNTPKQRTNEPTTSGNIQGNGSENLRDDDEASPLQLDQAVDAGIEWNNAANLNPNKTPENVRSPDTTGNEENDVGHSDNRQQAAGDIIKEKPEYQSHQSREGRYTLGENLLCREARNPSSQRNSNATLGFDGGANGKKRGKRKRRKVQRYGDGRHVDGEGTSNENLESLLQATDSDTLSVLLNNIGYGVIPISSNVQEVSEDFEGCEERRFDDQLPSELPNGMKDPEPYRGPDYPTWCDFITIVPSSWPAQNPIMHSAPWLDGIFMPIEHRANITITDTNELLKNHHFVFWRASYNFLLRKGSLRPSMITDVETLFGDIRGMDENTTRWACAISHDEYSMFYFGQKRSELMEKGFCTLEGFLDDLSLPEEIGAKKIPKVDGDGRYFVRLHKEMEADFPGEEALRESTNRKKWDVIVNRGSEKDQIAAQDVICTGRFSTTNYGVTGASETDHTKVWMCKARAILDTRVCQSVAALQIWDNCSAENVNMYVPRSGGRWLYTSRGCERQQLHTDFFTLSKRDTLLGTGNPGYFALCSAAQEVALWACPHSHRLVAAASYRELPALSFGVYTFLQKVPPFSIFIGRGDLYHAGAAFEDNSVGGGSLRYHLYFIPESSQLPDGVHILNHFKPHFLRIIQDDSDDEVETQTHDQNTVNRNGPVPSFEDSEEQRSTVMNGQDESDQNITFS